MSELENVKYHIQSLRSEKREGCMAPMNSMTVAVNTGKVIGQFSPAVYKWYGNNLRK